jgi:head-tail adaptor
MQEFSGALNARIRFEEAIDTLDANGITTRTWQEFATLWANVAPEPARLGLTSDGVVKPARVQVTLRRRVLPAVLRFLWQGYIWQVVARDHPVRAPDRLVLHAFVQSLAA